MKKNKVEIGAYPAVIMEAEVARRIRQHGRSSMKAEVCGVLIGREEGRVTTVEACIAGENAAQGGAHVTFTQDTWEHIYQIKDREYPDDRIVGWYHSHPGFGVFLSDHDEFIHQNFFSSPQQIAWVYDPHSDEEGCFGWHEKKIVKLDDVRLRYVAPMVKEGSGITEELEEKNIRIGELSENSGGSKWADWFFTVTTYLLVLVLGAFAGSELSRFKFERELADRLTREGPQSFCVGVIEDLIRSGIVRIGPPAPAGSSDPTQSTGPTGTTGSTGGTGQTTNQPQQQKPKGGNNGPKR